MIKIIKIFGFISLIFLASCQSIKDGLSGKKRDNSDEFLVKKKNPLVLPPNFNDLPKPKDKVLNEENFNDSDIENIIGSLSKEKSTSPKSKSIEDFVLKKIKKN